MASSRKAASDPRASVDALLRARVPSGARLTLAYSGGLDSSVLLHLLAELRGVYGYRLAAAHVHHGLSPRADAWAAHCAATCAALEVPMSVQRVRVRPAGEGPEAAARAARYRAFGALDTDFLALAQHRDDQAETLLLQLLRGGGPRAWAAMPAARALPGSGIVLLRPLLACPRAALADWARARAIAWVEDESNADLTLARNAARHVVLPAIAGHFPRASARLADAAERCAEIVTLLDDLAELDLARLRADAGLSLAGLAALPEARARNALRRFIEQAGARVREAALREGLRQLLAEGGAGMAVAFGPFDLRRFHGIARLVARAPATPAALPARLWHGEPRLELGELGRLEFSATTGAGLRLRPGAVWVGARVGGERFALGAGRPRRALKDLLREAGLPPWRRARLPLLYVDEELAWVAGIGADARFKVDAGEPGWLISWAPPW